MKKERNKRKREPPQRKGKWKKEKISIRQRKRIKDKRECRKKMKRGKKKENGKK